MTQLSLPLALPEIFLEGNFFLSKCNENAFNILLDAKNWEMHSIYLHGEKGSGKSHLANIWAQKMQAIAIPAGDIVPSSIRQNCLVEDIELCANERTLLHLFNHCRDIGVRLLLTSSYTPSGLPFTLPDLTSRLRGCQVVTIYPPDDSLIAGVMRKQFADKQLLVEDDVVDYLAARVERTLSNVKTIAEILDKNALSEHRKITIPFVKKWLYSQISS